MTESMVVNRWIREAVEQKGLEVTRSFLIRLLQGRFPGQITPDVIDAINAQSSRSVLEDWFDQAALVASFTDFLRILRP